MVLQRVQRKIEKRKVSGYPHYGQRKMRDSQRRQSLLMSYEGLGQEVWYDNMEQFHVYLDNARDMDTR